MPAYNGLYVTKNQIKKRYKYDERINLRDIKKIIKLYDIQSTIGTDGTEFINKQQFEEAVKKYLGL